MTGYVYSLTNPLDNKIIYIGSSFDPDKRLQQHIYAIRRGTSRIYKFLLEKQIIPQMSILETVEVTSQIELEKIEGKWVQKIVNSGYHDLQNVKLYEQGVQNGDFTSVKLSLELKSFLQEEAAAHDRSLSYWIRKILSDYVKAKKEELTRTSVS